MKSIYYLFFCFCLLPFSGCQQTKDNTEINNKNKETNLLDGSWIIRRGVGPYADRQTGQVYTFKGDKFQFNKDQMSFTGDVVVTDKSFTITTHKNQKSQVFYYRIEGDTMIMNMQNSQLTFYLVRIVTN